MKNANWIEQCQISSLDWLSGASVCEAYYNGRQEKIGQSYEVGTWKSPNQEAVDHVAGMFYKNQIYETRLNIDRL